MDLSEVSSNTNRHPWEISRFNCMYKEIKKLNKVSKVLDIGCGDAWFDKQLLKADKRINSLYGVDIYLEKPYTYDKGVWTNNLDEIKDKKFDLIVMMDVLEHIENDADYLSMIKEYLEDDGFILVTVPAFNKLCSLHDRELKHFRRYDRKMLKNLVNKSKLKIINISYFYFCLIILRLLTFNKTENLSMWQHDIKSFKTKFVTAVLNIDYNVLSFFSKFNIYIGGLSLFALIKKQ